MTAPSEVQVTAPLPSVYEEAPTADSQSHRGWRRGWSRRRLLSIGGVVLLVAAACFGTWALTGKGSSSAATPLSVSSQNVTVSTGTIKQSVSASGTLEPASQANLSFAVSGQVTAVDVSVGQSVTSGQTLATIDSTALQDSVNAANETLSADKARLSSDQSNGASTSEIDSDQASVTSAESQLATASQNLADANLTATVAGTVASIDLTVGQQVTGGGSSGGTGTGDSTSTSGLGTTATAATSSSSSSSSSAQIVVVSTNSYAVSATVDDTQVGQIKVGDQVTFQPSGSTATVYGTVSSIGLIASSSSDVASFPVTIAVTGTPSGLYAGSSVTVSITTEQLNNVVEVPTSAISYSNGQATVTKVVSAQHVSQAVTTGASASGYTQITSGLKAGDVIIERVVKFNATSGGGARNLFGGGGTSSGNLGGGGFPSGSGFPSGGGFPSSGGGG